MLYDVRIMNLLFIHRIYELQKDLECSNYIFVIAGAFHATEVSDVLQKKLGYNLVDQLPGIGNEIINLNSFLMAHITPEIEKNMLTSLDILLAPLHLLERIV